MISESKYEIQRNNHSRVCAPKNVDKKIIWETKRTEMKTETKTKKNTKTKKETKTNEEEN